MTFEFATARQIRFGPGALRQVDWAAVRQQGANVLVVTGANSGRAEPLLAILRAQSMTFTLFSVTGEPELGTVERGVALARAAGVTQVISFGGGSVIDAGKAMAAMLTNPGELLDYVEVIGRGQTLRNASAPFIAIPTTAGTGAEVTRNAVLAAPVQQVKVSLRSPFLLPALAVVDPELTRDLSPELTATTGLDALTQLIEPFLCRRANALTDGYCQTGLPVAARSLRTAVNHGDNAAAREDMALASLLGGLALANAGLGAVHGLAAPLGGQFPAPHGAVCAALLPHVLEVNLRALRQREPQHAALSRFDQLAVLLTGRPGATADEAVAWVRALVADLPVPRLGRYGLTPADFPGLIAKAANASSMKANPIVLTPDELTEILQRAC